MDNQELLTLLALWDDPDKVVRDAVFNRLEKEGRPILDRIQGLLQGPEGPAGAPGTWKGLTDLLHLGFVLDDLVAWKQGPDPDLFRGLCLTLQALFPEVDAEVLDPLVKRDIQEIWIELTDNQTLMEQVKLFNYCFFRRLRYNPVDPFLRVPRFAFVDMLLTNKTGNPVLMGLLYVYYAYQLGLPIKAYRFTGGYLPGVVDPQGKLLFYVNVYQRGALMDLDKLEDQVKTVHKGLDVKEACPATALDMVHLYAESLCYIFMTRQEEGPASKMRAVINILGGPMRLSVEMEEDEED